MPKKPKTNVNQPLPYRVCIRPCRGCNPKLSAKKVLANTTAYGFASESEAESFIAELKGDWETARDYSPAIDLNSMEAANGTH